MSYAQLEKIANNIRQSIIQMVYDASSGHPGGSLSAVEILSYLYFKEMNISDPNDENRDRFILSKGHAAPVLYAVLAEKGFIEKDSLKTLRKINSKLQGHPDMKKVAGVEASTGSLGQGLSIANGMAYGFRMDNRPSRVFVLLGDGEVQEGMIWEAAMFAGHNKLSNVTAVLDHNGLQIDGKNEDVVSVEPLDKKFEAFGWHVIKIDGNDFSDIEKAFEERKKITDKPVMIIAKTVKGKGVSYMENVAGWHGKAPNDEELSLALKELGGNK